MAKMPKVLNHERRGLKSHRCYIISVGAKKWLKCQRLTTISVGGQKCPQNAKGVTP
ncbi:hypothetical protein COLO4_23860 [Corchorus olitorius]|uniref:Uncharacterized protein n=1 Tax=Corchorus olitorius TaxID=93759 RepID=A0A1R3IE93_9ROSI|nr:hypothetical protein COLO4_23860 [Corchorus olitorius]